MSSPSARVTESIAEEGAGLVVITANYYGRGISLREGELEEARTVAASTEGCEYDPRILLHVIGPPIDAPLECRFDLAVLRLILVSANWCRWVDVETLSYLSTDEREIGVICGWLQAARADLRLAAHDLLLQPAAVRATASRLLEIEDRLELY